MTAVAPAGNSTPRRTKSPAQPPGRVWTSATTTSRPRFAANAPAVSPAMPAPTTSRSWTRPLTSKSLVVVFVIRGEQRSQDCPERQVSPDFLRKVDRPIQVVHLARLDGRVEPIDQQHQRPEAGALGLKGEHAAQPVRPEQAWRHDPFEDEGERDTGEQVVHQSEWTPEV